MNETIINPNYDLLPGSYLFSTIAKKISEYQAKKPDADIVRLGIGDVTQPLCPTVINALHKAVDEMASADTFRGYAPDLGYQFLRETIVEKAFKPLGAEVRQRPKQIARQVVYLSAICVGEPRVQFQERLLQNVLSIIAVRKSVAGVPQQSRPLSLEDFCEFIFGDVISFSGGHADDTQIAAITGMTVKINGKTTLKCVGKNPRLSQAKSKNDKN